MKKGHPISRKLGPSILRRAIVVSDPLLALGRLSAFHRNRYAPLIVAVTGSNGKTTTKEMLAAIFYAALGKHALATEKNYNNHIGLPFTLFRISERTRAVVLEMGMNHAGEIGYLSRLARPHLALITSIGHAHIGYLGSRQKIAMAKAEIVEGMETSGKLILPAEISERKTLEAAARKHRIPIETAHIKGGKGLSILGKSTTGFDLKYAGHRFSFPYPGESWVSNLAMVAEAANQAGLQTSQIINGISKFKPAGGRMQFSKGYFTVIDDGYNANSDSAIASMQAAKQVAGNRAVYCIFGEFRELGILSKKLHFDTGAAAARLGINGFIGIAGNMKHAVQAFNMKTKSSTKGIFLKREPSQILEALTEAPRNSVILVKGSRAMKMEEIAQILKTYKPALH